MLRNGELVGEYKAADLPKLELIEKMIGKEVGAQHGPQGRRRGRRPRARRRPGSASRPQAWPARAPSHPSTWRSAKGEVLGLAGLLGSGRTETARLCSASTGPTRAGEDQRPAGQSLNSPRSAIRHGIGFCPEDRKTDGIIGELTVRENIILGPAGQARRRSATFPAKAAGDRRPLHPDARHQDPRRRAGRRASCPAATSRR